MHPVTSLAVACFLAISSVEDRAPSKDLTAAKQSLEFTAWGQKGKLKELSKSSPDCMERLFAAYLLYRIDPKSNAQIFIRAFPSNEQEVSRFIALTQTIPYSPDEEDQEYRNPKVKWTIGFWSIYKAFHELVKAENEDALKKFLLLDGSGDGAIAEGIASDIANIFYNPSYVLKHWNLLEPHKEFLRSVKTWVTDENQFIRIRHEYDIRLKVSDSRRAIILNLLDNPE